MKIAMVLLVGEQPAPNMLPVRQLMPDAAILVHTDYTRMVAKNLRDLLKPNCENLCCCRVHPYKIPDILDSIRDYLLKEFPNHSFIFNLTGGTKPMAIAAFQLAHIWSSPIIYFQTEGDHSLLYTYRSDENEIKLEKTEKLDAIVSLDDYLRMYLHSYETGEPRDEFERQVIAALRTSGCIDEVFCSVRPEESPSLEIDFVIRCGSKFGVGEVKTKGAKSGIDQLNAVAEQRYLGTYVRKFLVSGNPLDPNNSKLARAYGIEVIELSSYGRTKALDSDDNQKLVKSVLDRLGVRR